MRCNYITSNVFFTLTYLISFGKQMYALFLSAERTAGEPEGLAMPDERAVRKAEILVVHEVLGVCANHKQVELFCSPLHLHYFCPPERFTIIYAKNQKYRNYRTR